MPQIGHYHEPYRKVYLSLVRASLGFPRTQKPRDEGADRSEISYAISLYVTIFGHLGLVLFGVFARGRARAEWKNREEAHEHTYDIALSGENLKFRLWRQEPIVFIPIRVMMEVLHVSCGLLTLANFVLCEQHDCIYIVFAKFSMPMFYVDIWVILRSWYSAMNHHKCLTLFYWLQYSYVHMYYKHRKERDSSF